MRKVPAVVDETASVITESGAILYHFTQGTPLWPEGLDARAEALRWMFFERYNHQRTLAVGAEGAAQVLDCSGYFGGRGRGRAP